MVLKVIGSSSSGNCYLLQGERETLIIEAGLKFIEIKKALNFKLQNVVGCLISHKHQDHSLSVGDMVKNGIMTYCNESVIERHGLKGKPFVQRIKPDPKKGFCIGEFRVVALAMKHSDNNGEDCPCLGFIITHPEMGKLLFATDTMMIRYKISGLHHIMVEANYCDAILDENIANGTVLPSERERLMRSHMELQTTAQFLKANDLSTVNEVVLLHLSSRNSEPQMFHDAIAKVIGYPVYVATPGLTIELSPTAPY